MAYTLATVRTDIKDRLRNANYTDALVDQYINATQRHITNRYALRFMETSTTQATTQSDYDYALPADFQQMLTLRITAPTANVSDITKNYLTNETFDAKYPAPTDEGTPSYWTVYGDDLLVYPVPDATVNTLTLKYLKSATTLTDDSDVPEIPEEYQEVLITGALYRIFQSDDQYAEAMNTKDEHTALVEDMLNRLSVRTRGTVSKIGVA